jgi:hypothetical protein
MIGVPQLRRHEDVLARHAAHAEACPKRLTDLTLVSIAFRAVEVAKAGVQGVSGRAKRHGCIRNQSAEPAGRDLAGPVLERDPHRPKISRFNHGRSFDRGLLATIGATRGANIHAFWIP